jgi:uncharacterized membrane protein YiaA
MTDASDARRTIQWAAFLACSWTWCIGMFLPVLLLRDFGYLAFIAFLVPNVAGAAAMGWVIRSPEDSAALVSRHLAACRAFSAITAAFQVYFACWLLSAAAAPVWHLLVGVMVAVIALSWRRSLRAAVALWVVSAGAFAILLATGVVGTAQLGAMPAPELPRAEVLLLAPVCVLGFLLCPYLDLTFHAAAQRAGAGRRAAFGLGFGGLFSVMVVFTLFYAPLLPTRPDLHAPALPSWTVGLVLVHIVAQLTYTFFLHHAYLHETRRQARAPGSAAPYLTLIFVSATLGLFAPRMPQALGLSMGEQVYRAFMGFYGLIFPAYVWICMVPRGAPGPTRQKIRVWAFAVGVALPMFAMGFIARQTWWLGPGIAVVLAARLFVPRVRAGSSAEPLPRSV